MKKIEKIKVRLGQRPKIKSFFDSFLTPFLNILLGQVKFENVGKPLDLWTFGYLDLWTCGPLDVRLGQVIGGTLEVN